MNRVVTFGSAFLVLTAGLAASQPGRPDLTSYGQENGRFTVIGLPDTQRYSESYPDVFRAQSDWIVANRYAQNINFVSHYGDIVQHGNDQQEWANARYAMEPLMQSGIPLSVSLGNHDVTPTGTSGEPYDASNYLRDFGPQHFQNRSWFGGASPSGRSTYQRFGVKGQEFLHLNLSVDTPLSELTWAQDVLAANRDSAVMVTTHRYLQDAEDYTAGVPVVPSGRYPEIWYGIEGTYDPDGMHAEEFFQSFVRTNKNIFMVNCGHFHEEYRQTSQNLWGNNIHEVLADYQDDPNGGNGWLRMMEFDTNNNSIGVRSYSPYLNEERFTDESRFTLQTNFDSYRNKQSVTFQQGVLNYQGTQDTWINEASGGTSYGSNSTFNVDDDTNNSFFSDSRGQGLLRFDNMFTLDGANNTVPQGATITNATLRIVFEDDVDFVFDADIDVYMANRDWNESSTWDSLGDGLSGGELGDYLGRLSGDNGDNGDGWRILDVTDAVRQWASGAANFGFAILPEIISGNDDGVTVWASEAGNLLYRPALDIEYSLPARMVPAPSSAILLMLAGGTARRSRRG